MRETQDKVGEAKAAPQRTVVALKGQLLHWRLLVANAGQPPMVTAKLPTCMTDRPGA